MMHRRPAIRQGTFPQALEVLSKEPQPPQRSRISSAIVGALGGANFKFTRMNIALTILRKKIEDLLSGIEGKSSRSNLCHSL